MKNKILLSLILTGIFVSSITAMPLPSLFVISKAAQKIDLIKSLYINSEVTILEDKDLKITLKEQLYYDRATNTIELLITNINNGKTVKIQRTARGCFAVIAYNKKNLTCSSLSSNIFYRTLFRSGLSRFLHDNLNVEFDNSSITHKRNPDKSYIAPNDIKVSLLDKKPVFEIGKNSNKIFIDINKFNILKVQNVNTSISYKNYHEYLKNTISFPSTINFKKGDIEANYDLKSVSINQAKPNIFDKIFSYGSLDSEITDYVTKFR